MKKVLLVCITVILCNCNSYYSPEKLFKETLTTLDNNKFYFSSIKKHKFTSVFFLYPDCPMCINYSSVINNINKKIKTLNTLCIIPSKHYSIEEIKEFISTYKLNYPILIDSKNNISNLLNATTVPEVFLIDNNGQIKYNGAIDNWAIELGKNRGLTTEHFLLDAINEVAEGKTVTMKYVKPIGCIID